MRDDVGLAATILNKYFPRSNQSEEVLDKDDQIAENLMKSYIKFFRDHSNSLIVMKKKRDKFFESFDKQFNETFFDVFATKIKELVNLIEEILPKTRIEQVSLHVHFDPMLIILNQPF